MKKSQWKLIEIWSVVIIFFITLGIFQESKVFPFLAIISVGIYILVNSKNYHYFNNHYTKLSDIIGNSKVLKIFTLLYTSLLIVVTFYFLFSGKNLGYYLNSFWSISFVVMPLIIVPLIFSQISLFKRLGENEL